MRKNYRIGLDVGTNSLGWSVLLLDKNGDPNTIEAAGVRIFSDGRVKKSKATLAADRRVARLARRRRDRFKQRQKFLLNELTETGLFPEDEQACADLQKQNPLELRAHALNEKLSPHQIGRALFHLNQRRGFNSNRSDKSEESGSDGKIARSARLLLEKMELLEPKEDDSLSKEEFNKLSKEEKKRVQEEKKQANKAEYQARKKAFENLKNIKNLTYGSFLYARHKNKQSTRVRPTGHKKDDLYLFYPIREMYEDEFNKIWNAQAAHHPDLMTDEQKERIHYVIFTQRPLKLQKRGKCTYMPKEDRTFRAMPSFQRYRIYQEVNNLEWATSAGRHLLIHYPEARDAIVHLLEHPTTKNGQVTFGNMKKELKNIAEGNFQFNFETPKRKGFDGNLTSNVMQHEDYVGPEWHEWDLEKQDEFIDIILNGTPEQQKRDVEEEKARKKGKTYKKTIADGSQDDKEIAKYLRQHFSLQEQAAEKCVNAPLQEGTANVSLKAAKLMLEKMRGGIEGIDQETGEVSAVLPIQPDAAEACAQEMPGEFENPMRRKKTDEGAFSPEDKMPYYGEWFRDGRHIIPGDRREEDWNDKRKFFGGVTNPTVHIALNQIRQVVNELIGCYGHPASIAIELGRDLPAGQEGRSEITKEQKKNQDRNDRFDKSLREYGQLINRENRLRLLLWEELDADPNGRCCPFSGDKIGISDLFNGNAEIEHLIPFSRSLDDSRANKVICTREANRYKGTQTPFEAFGESPGGYAWDEIFERAKKLPKPKQWRFQEDAMKIWERGNDFTARHLNDTRYIGRLAREYLECICHIDKIDVLTGRLTALLRWQWGLNSVLRDDARSQDQKFPAKKNRDDHRHHAVDAIVIGMTSRSMLQKIASAANRAEKLRLDAIFEKHNDGKSAIDPWDGFRNEVRETVKSIIVSHKSKRKKVRYEKTKNGRYIPVSTDGQLHNETAYGVILILDEGDGLSEVVVRKPVNWFEKEDRTESIRDPSLRNQFKQAFKAGGKNQVMQLAGSLGIRNLRRTEKLKVIPVKDKTGKVYKAYKGDSNWAMEIYEYPRGHEKAGRWEGILISRFAANQHNFQPGQTYKPHPAARLVMRLQINDCIEIEENGKKQFLRLQNISGHLTFADPNEANVDARNRDKGDPFKYYLKSASTLKSVNARKVHISPTGKINYEIRRKPRRKP